MSAKGQGKESSLLSVVEEVSSFKKMMGSSVKKSKLQVELQLELQLINYLRATSESTGSETNFTMLIYLTSIIEDIHYCSLGMDGHILSTYLKRREQLLSGPRLEYHVLKIKLGSLS